MQEGSKLLLSLVDSEKSGFSEFMDYQLTDDMFKGGELELYEFISGHVKKYGKLPKRKTMKQWAKENKTTIPPKESLVEPAKFYFDRMQHRNVKLSMKKALQVAAEKVNEDTPIEALAELSTSVMEMTNTQRATKLINFAQVGGKIIKSEFAKVHHPDTQYGLRLGWPSFDAMSGGLVGGDVASIVGRPSMGKTYMMLFGMNSAWLDGMVPLFVSMEMNTTLIAQRLTALHTKTSATEIKKAMVAKPKFRRMLTQLYSMKDKQDMWIADGALSASVTDLIYLCQQLRPEVLFIDGAYLLRHENLRLSRWDRVSVNAEMIKCQLAEALNIPVVVTYQLNRETTKRKTKDVGVENIAYSDSIGQLSSVVLGLFEEDSVETKLQRKVRILKGRHGESGEFTINWRFGGMGKHQDGDTDTHDVMNFEEIIDEYTDLNEKYI